MIRNLSVFFPAYNEAQNIKETVRKAVGVLEKLKITYEILIVNDGSFDDTLEVAKSLEKENKKIKVLNHEKNLGYGAVLKSGFYSAKYDTIVYTDSDGQFDFREVSKFIEKLDEADLIVGYRIRRADPPLRLLFAKGWALSLFTFFGLNLKDVDCGFKMIKKKVLNKIPKLESTRGGMINAELVIKAKKFGFKIVQVGVNHYPRTLGKPTGANIRVIFKSYFDLLKLWWKLNDNKLVFTLLIFVLGLAAFFRFYRLPEYMTFLGDEGRDALVVKGILTTGHIPLLGPPTSIGNMYLGPLYYYMMALAMAIFWLNPVAAAGQVALIGVLTVWLIYYLGKEWFGKIPGLMAAFLYAISPITIIYSRSSWNPNPAPFFALLSTLGFYKAYKGGNYLWFTLTGVSLAFAVQMHYLALILLPIALLLWFLGVFVFHPPGVNRKYVVGGTISAVVLFLILMSPLVIFDLRHNFMNYKAVSAFFSNRETTVNINPLNSLGRAMPIYSHDLVGRYMSAEDPITTPLLSILILIPLIYAGFATVKDKALKWPYLTLGLWLFGGVFGLTLYKQTIYDHYLGFLNPAPFLLFGSIFGLIKITDNRKRVIMALVAALLIGVMAVLNLERSPLKYPPNNQLSRTQAIANFVIGQAEDKPFNFALIAKSNYDSAYQFYLEVYGYKPNFLPTEMTDQLFVVCEDPVCQPIGHPKYEIAAFGWAKIAEEQDFNGIKVYKLVHNPSGKP